MPTIQSMGHCGTHCSARPVPDRVECRPAWGCTPRPGFFDRSLRPPQEVKMRCDRRWQHTPEQHSIPLKSGAAESLAAKARLRQSGRTWGGDLWNARRIHPVSMSGRVTDCHWNSRHGELGETRDSGKEKPPVTKHSVSPPGGHSPWNLCRLRSRSPLAGDGDRLRH